MRGKYDADLGEYRKNRYIIDKKYRKIILKELFSRNGEGEGNRILVLCTEMSLYFKTACLVSATKGKLESRWSP